MDTLSGKQTCSEAFSLIEWEKALTAEDPSALVGMLSSCAPPELLGNTPWPIRLARKVSIVQWWAAGNWQSPFYSGWMLAWDTQPPIPNELWPEILQESLMAMGRSEHRFKPGQMHHSLWLSYIDEMVKNGMDLNSPIFFGKESCTALDYLLTQATSQPYPEIAIYWIDRYGAAFSKKTAEKAIDIMERMQDPYSNRETINKVIRRLFLAMQDYQHNTQVKIADWFDTITDERKDNDLMAYVDHIFLSNQTRNAEGKKKGRRL